VAFLFKVSQEFKAALDQENVDGIVETTNVLKNWDGFLSILPDIQSKFTAIPSFD